MSSEFDKVKWFSFPWIAPRGRGPKPPPAQGKIEEIEPPKNLLSSSCPDDPKKMTPQKRREFIVESLVIGLWRVAKRQSIGNGDGGTRHEENQWIPPT